VFERKTSRELNEKLRGELTRLGMQINDVSPQEKARMREKLKGVIDKHMAGASEDAAREFFAEIDKTRKR
jgi:hypothetical protein